MRILFIPLIVCLLVSPLFAQTDLAGTWNTGKENTIVKLFEEEGMYFGEIVASDSKKVEIGKQIIKDLKNEDGTWKGKLFVLRKKKWVDAAMSVKDNNLSITVKAGIVSKTVVWEKVTAN